MLRPWTMLESAQKSSLTTLNYPTTSGHLMPLDRDLLLGRCELRHLQ